MQILVASWYCQFLNRPKEGFDNCWGSPNEIFEVDTMKLDKPGQRDGAFPKRQIEQKGTRFPNNRSNAAPL